MELETVMAYQVGYFDPEERSREKWASRDEDSRRLRDGEVSREQLRRENGLFSAFDVKQASIGRKNIRPASR